MLKTLPHHMNVLNAFERQFHIFVAFLTLVAFPRGLVSLGIHKGSGVYDLNEAGTRSGLS